MNLLENHTILYDEDCPMCHVYTGAFIKFGWLPKNGREAYQNMPDHVCKLIDHQRAVNEIALVNTVNGEVTYGISSLFKIIANALPVFKPLFRFAPFIWFMKKIYAFVSYNRKVIIPAKIKENVLQPSFSLKYRLAYLTFAWLITSIILTKYTAMLTNFVPIGNSYREYLICGGQMVFQAAIIIFYKKDKLWDYLGNMMTVSLAGALILIPALIVNHFLIINTVFYLLFFLFTAGLMLLEHIRRCKILDLGWLMSITWVTYRLIVLVLILL
ncbi:DUF393 domain-containing protein [Pedobacter changchengzhani]|uniref:DUF393 domain-containing protein n=1 Tax=Pedobacter changchengzhani TaxID=2529274 RepID=A0A4R5MNG6_9SPHI|nr:DUF393 domain-containing protein [Pedobacter changchengzhani]TDG37198.1 DUF393 domain-containing protein [Pedobacter changchengzhani]